MRRGGECEEGRGVCEEGREEGRGVCEEGSV